MSDFQLTTPVAFIIFNRPDLTKRVFERIREARPRQLFIAADGPRSDVAEDEERCARARQVVEQVDWECEVHTLFRERNLGCKRAVSSAIDWFFEHVEAGIILEDDCLPTLQFFPFCDELLTRYADDDRVGMVSGNNYGFELYDNRVSYSFSKNGIISGWATWRRAWRQYQLVLEHLTSHEIELIKQNISDYEPFADMWWHQAEAALEGKINSWAYIWGVARYASNFLTIRPRVNMVANIGFGPEATHTRGQAPNQYVSTGELGFPLVHPRPVVPDRHADRMLEEFRAPKRKEKTGINKLLWRVKRRVLRIL